MVANSAAFVGRQTSGRQRLNIPGAIDLETGKTRMIMLLMAVEKIYPGKRRIHLFVDDARFLQAS
jgi:hypothetical protein